MYSVCYSFPFRSAPFHVMSCHSFPVDSIRSHQSQAAGKRCNIHQTRHSEKLASQKRCGLPGAASGLGSTGYSVAIRGFRDLAGMGSMA